MKVPGLTTPGEGREDPGPGMKEPGDEARDPPGLGARILGFLATWPGSNPTKAGSEIMLRL